MSQKRSDTAERGVGGKHKFFAPKNEGMHWLAEKACPNHHQFKFVGTYPFGIPAQLMECYTHTNTQKRRDVV
jgi:hypothetical protein